MATQPLRIGVDAGGTKIAALVAGPGRQPLGRARVPTDLASPQDTLDSIVEAVNQALAQVPATLADVAAIGLGLPGRVQPATGLVESAVNLGWRQLPVGPLLSERLGVPCRLENDTRAAALGAYALPGEQQHPHWAYLSVGTGIAAALVLGGRLYRGPHGMAGEVGHMVVAPGGPSCACGLRGCLETVAAGPAIVRAARAWLADLTAAAATSRLGNPDELTTQQVYAAAAAGDELALTITRQAGRYLARAVHALVMICDVDRVMIGGGVANAGQPFLAPLCAGLDQLRQASPLAAEVLPPDLVGLLPAGYEAALWGAVALTE